MATYYGIVLAVSVVLAIIYVFIYHKHFDIHITLLYLLIPVANIGYFLSCTVNSLDEELTAIRMTYIGGCFCPLMILLAVLSLCEINIRRSIKVAIFSVCFAVYFVAFTMGHNDLYYKSVTFDPTTKQVVKEYGPLHSLFIIMVLGMFTVSLVVIVYCYLKKNQVSRIMLALLVLPEAICIIAFFFIRNIKSVDTTPLAFDLALVVYLIIVYKMRLYDISDSAIDSLVQTGDTGFISFDFKYNYIGSNETAKGIFPQLKDLTVDKSIDDNEFFRTHAHMWLDDFKNDDTKNEVYFNKHNKTYLISIKYLFDGLKKRGYQFFITDDTKNQQYIRLINTFNTELQSEVEQKTEHIQKMHDNLILSMATMVESRDNSTGGHIRRTSEVVRILIDEIKKAGDMPLDDEFCKDIIKAAPMHDLGKIAVDDSILRKPGRFTDEEYEKMKVHAAEGARIVHEILSGTDDERFKVIAENVAHFHHERVDGSGYPDGLKGDEIPLEARIMAVADVYDALVSKRVYKERMSFKQADSIITEGMGKHFDKALEPYYRAARPRLEEYYRENDS
ncbi:MAG: HD domain-containing protein [Ruminococcus sp.]|nr:HD domain-containing protein [Ruminococcus sp.]